MAAGVVMAAGVDICWWSGDSCWELIAGGVVMADGVVMASGGEMAA